MFDNPETASLTSKAYKKRESGVDDAANELAERDGAVINIVVVHGDPNKPNKILPGGKWDEDDFAAPAALKAAFDIINTDGAYHFSFLCNHDTLIDDLRKLKSQGKVDLAMQFCDEGWENNPHMELHMCALLEMLHIPYTGNGPACIGFTANKGAQLSMAASIGIPVPRTVYIEDESKGIDLKGLMYPVLVKPNATDGSFGITKKNVCHNEGELLAAIKQIRELFNVHCPLLVQEFLDGRDINCVIIGNSPDPKVLPLTEEDYSALPEGWPKICGFESKWDSESPYWNLKTVPTTLDAKRQQLIRDCSLKLFTRLGACDYARFDWRLDAEGNPRLLEANPNCGWCDDGHMAKTCGLAGISYPEMIKMIIDTALLRLARKKEPELCFIDLNLVRDPVSK